VKANPDKHWSYAWLSLNPNITWDIVDANPDIPWDYGMLSGNPMGYNFNRGLTNMMLKGGKRKRRTKRRTCKRKKSVNKRRRGTNKRRRFK
jgi:hypothetical protein